MAKKPTYEELEQRVNELEKESAESNRIEKLLRDSEERYRLLVENSHDVPYSVTPDGIITFVGPQISRFGYTHEDVTAKHFLEFVVPEQRQEVMHSFEKGTNNTSYPTEFQLEGKGGNRYWVEVVGRNIFDNSGRPMTQIGMLRDISKRKEAEEALLDVNNHYQRLIEDLGDNFVIYSHRLDGTLTYASSGIKSIFGVSREEAKGGDWSKMIKWDSRDRELATENIRNIVSGLEYKRMEMSFRHPDGKQRTVLISPHPTKNSEGSVVAIEGIIEDITKRKEVEEVLKEARTDLKRKVKERTAQLSETVDKLREAELRFRTVADFTYDWEYWTNLDGTLKYVSPSCERISGYTPHHFMGNPSLCHEIIIPEDQDIWDNHYCNSRQDPGAREIQFRIRARDGSIRWIEHACQPVTGEQGELQGFRASNRDITMRKEGAIKLQNAYSEITELKAQLEADRTYLREEIKLEHDYENIIGNSDILKYVLFRAEQVAPTDTTVLILGETGTGKELIARAIHNAGPRRGRPLIKVDCASLPANLIESELFGHEKGAFTGAVEERVGRFELANGATLFLDEIGELPLDLQPKLLRVLQDGEFERLGSSQTLHTDVRFIAATNRNLEEDVHKKLFRMDLWYRLSVFTISVPALRERSEDIVLLVKYMIKNFERKLGKRIRSVHTSVISKLQNYSWPGNVRELENVIERAIINTQGDTLQLEDSLNVYRPGGAESPDLPIESLETIEREHILLALRKTNWKIHGENGAAALLDINSSTLRGRMRKQGILRPPYKI